MVLSGLRRSLRRSDDYGLFNMADYAWEILENYVTIMEGTYPWMHDPANKQDLLSIMQNDLSIPAKTAQALHDNNLDDYPDHVALCGAD